MKKRDKICFAISFAGIAILILALVAMHWTDLQPVDDGYLEKYRLFCIGYVIFTFLGTPLALYWVFKGFKEIEQDKLSPKGFAILDICFCEFMGCITLTGLLLAIEIITHMLGVYCPEMLIKCISTSDAAIILMLFLGAGMVLFPTLIQISSIIDGYDE